MPAYMPQAKTSEWGTPSWLFNALNEEFGFTLDVCASHVNAKCEKYNSLAEPDAWTWDNEICWMNPPYGNALNNWMMRASTAQLSTVVALVPSRTDTQWWHRYVMERATEVRFIEGRLTFEGATSSAPFASAIVIYEYDPGSHPAMRPYRRL